MLVLDDFQKIIGSDVPAQLELLLHRCRPAMRLVVSSRVEPRLRLHRYRLADQLTEIRSDELAFSKSEIREMLANHSGARGRPESIAAVYASTEGWAAGIRLLSMAPGPPGDGSAADDTSSADGYVADYLTAEVLNALPVELRTFLVRTSVVEWLSPELADVLTGRSDSARVLAALVRTNSFVQACLEPGRYFRYHPLLRRLLRVELEQQSPALARELTRASALWLTRHRSLRDGLTVAGDSADWSLAAGVVVDGFRITDLLTGTDRIGLAEFFQPAANGPSDARAAVVLAAKALANADTDGCRSQLACAREQSVDADPALALAVAMVELQLAWANADAQQTLDAAATAEAILDAQPDQGVTTCPDYWATLLNTAGAALLWTGEQRAAEASFHRADQLAERSNCQQARVNSLGHLALAALMSRQRARARALAKAAANLADEIGAPAALRPAAGYVAMAWISAEDGDLCNSRIHAHRARTASAWLRTDPLSAAVLARLLVQLGGNAERYACAGTGSLAWSIPAWLDDRLVTVSAARSALTGTHGAAVAQQVVAMPSTLGPRLHAVPSCEPILIEPLTEKEQEVLRHLSALLSTAEVAQTMYISVNTVRTHVRGILRKLAATRRNEAIRRARQLQLI